MHFLNYQHSFKKTKQNITFLIVSLEVTVYDGKMTLRLEIRDKLFLISPNLCNLL